MLHNTIDIVLLNNVPIVLYCIIPLLLSVGILFLMHFCSLSLSLPLSLFVVFPSPRIPSHRYKPFPGGSNDPVALLCLNLCPLLLEGERYSLGVDCRC